MREREVSKITKFLGIDHKGGWGMESDVVNVPTFFQAKRKELHPSLMQSKHFSS